ncbi:MAG: DUF3501 family protein [Myxococcales bacterium]|nr:DUF3501 family protein [Myxococcales bacterium]
MTVPEALLERLQLPSAAAYVRVRRDYQAFVSRIKARRRLRLGPDAALLFEDDETVRAQILEVLHVEGRSASRLARVVADYACLLPSPGELRATLFIDGVDRELGRRIGAAACARAGLVVHAGSVVLVSAPAEGEAAVADPAAHDACVHYLALRRDATISSDVAGWSVRLALAQPIDAPIDEPLRGALLAELDTRRPARTTPSSNLTQEIFPWPFSSSDPSPTSRAPR